MLIPYQKFAKEAGFVTDRFGFPQQDFNFLKLMLENENHKTHHHIEFITRSLTYIYQHTYLLL